MLYELVSYRLIMFLPVICLFHSMQIHSWQPNESGLYVVCGAAWHHHGGEESVPKCPAPSHQYARLWLDNHSNHRQSHDSPERSHTTIHSARLTDSWPQWWISIPNLLKTLSHWNLLTLSQTPPEYEHALRTHRDKDVELATVVWLYMVLKSSEDNSVSMSIYLKMPLIYRWTVQAGLICIFFLSPHPHNPATLADF